MQPGFALKSALSKNSEKLLVFIILLYAFFSALFANSHFTVEDAAIHSEIAGVLKNNFYPNTYEPVANVPFTYTPLFHYIAVAFTFLGLETLDAVKLLGALSFAFFPLAMYFLGSLFGRRAGIFSALSAVITTNIFMVLIFSEYPEILSFDILAMFLYFYFRKRYSLAGIFLGATMLTHFTGAFAAASAAMLFILRKDRHTLKTISIGFLISLFWLPKYLAVLSHFLEGTWNNVRWYSANGFISFESLANIVWRLNPFIVAISIVGIIALKKMNPENEGRKKFFIFLYFLPFIFTIYHYSPAQYKFLDMLTIPAGIFFGIGCDYALGKLKGTNPRIPATLLMSVVLLASIPFPLLKISELQGRYSVITPDVADAAAWLKAYDSKPVRILLALNSSAADKETLVFESELVFSQMSDKIPLDASISDIEAYTPEYKMQLEDRERMINGNWSLLENYEVKYVISARGKCPLNRIYESGKIEICRDGI